MRFKRLGCKREVCCRRCAAGSLPFPSGAPEVLSIVRAEAEPVSEALLGGRVGGGSRFAGRFGTDREAVRGPARPAKRDPAPTRPRTIAEGYGFLFQPVVTPVQRYR